MTDANAANAYLRTKVMSASPAELRLMLMDGAIKFASQAREGLEKKDYEQSFAGFSQCRAIVLELLTTIRPEPNPELADRVKALYTFIYRELVDASFEKDQKKLAKVIELLEYERETWAMVMERAAAEQAYGSASTQAAHDDAPRALSGLSIQA
jgi:flagellar protein FliS